MSYCLCRIEASTSSLDDIAALLSKDYSCISLLQQRQSLCFHEADFIQSDASLMDFMSGTNKVVSREASEFRIVSI